MDPSVYLIIGLVVGGICAAMAGSKGRSSIGWFFAGVFFGLIAIVIIAVLPNLKEQERQRNHATAERRRLREQLRQEKMKTEAFRQHATGRLDTHDTALGLDTRQQAGLAQGAPVTPPPLPKPTAALDETPWFYDQGGETKGPVPQSTLVWMLETGALGGATLVWTEGWSDWVAAASVPTLRPAADGAS